MKHGVDDTKAIERPEPSEKEAPERALVVTEQRVEHGDQVLTGLLLGVHLGLEVQRSSAPEGAVTNMAPFMPFRVILVIE